MFFFSRTLFYAHPTLQHHAENDRSTKISHSIGNDVGSHFHLIIRIDRRLPGTKSSGPFAVLALHKTEPHHPSCCITPTPSPGGNPIGFGSFAHIALIVASYFLKQTPNKYSGSASVMS